MYNLTVCKNQLHHLLVNADTNKICHTPLKLTVSFTLSPDFWWSLYRSHSVGHVLVDGWSLVAWLAIGWSVGCWFVQI